MVNYFLQPPNEIWPPRFTPLVAALRWHFVLLTADTISFSSSLVPDLVPFSHFFLDERHRFSATNRGKKFSVLRCSYPHFIFSLSFLLRFYKIYWGVRQPFHRILIAQIPESEPRRPPPQQWKEAITANLQRRGCDSGLRCFRRQITSTIAIGVGVGGSLPNIRLPPFLPFGTLTSAMRPTAILHEGSEQSPSLWGKWVRRRRRRHWSSPVGSK